MANPTWHHNVLACYPAILTKLKQISQVKKVLEAQDFTSIGNKARQIPLDGAVYVIFDGFTPKVDNNTKREQILEIGFSVILTKTNITLKPATDGVGETLTAIMKALQGFMPENEHGDELTLTPLHQKSALPIQYENGFAYFPMRFTCDVAIIT